MRSSDTFLTPTPRGGRCTSNQRMWKACAAYDAVSWNRSGASRATVKPPMSRPFGLNIGVSAMRSSAGTRFAIRRESRASASSPSTRYLPKLWISLMPAASRTARLSPATGAKA